MHISENSFSFSLFKSRYALLGRVDPGLVDSSEYREFKLCVERTRRSLERSGDAIFHGNNLRTLLVEWNVHHSFRRRAGTREKCPAAHLNELHRHIPISDEMRR